MYQVVQRASDYAVIGIDGDVVASRPTQTEAERAAAELKREYAQLLAGFDLVGAVEEACSNLFRMDREAHHEIAVATQEKKRDKRWNRQLGVFTEASFREGARKDISQEEYRAAVEWTPSGEVYRPRNQSNDEKKWATKLREALK